MFFKDFKEVRGDETKIKTVFGNLQISFFAEVGPQGQRQLAVKNTQRRRTRMKGGKSTRKWCRKFVGVSMTYSQSEGVATKRPGWNQEVHFS